MNKRELADRFSSDVDQLLREAGLVEPKPTGPEYEDALHLARTLATTDFSRQSQIRHSLRRRLLSRIEPAPDATTEIPGPINRIKQLFKPEYTRLSWSSLSPVGLFHNKLILAGLIIVFSFVVLLSLPSLLPVRQKMVEVLAQVLAYLPIEQEISPHALALRWQFRGDDGISSPPVTANGFIYAGSNAGYLYALDAQTGREIWRYKAKGGISLAPAAAFGLVYAVSEDGYLYALDNQTGLEKWRFQTDGRFSLGPTIAARMVLVGAADGTLYALAADTGEEQWHFKAGNAILPGATVAEDILYVGSRDHYLYALHPETGQEKWRFNIGDWLSAAPVEVAGLVYVGSYDENLYILDAATGRELRRYDLGKAVRTSATLAGGIIYFGSYDSYLHAVDGATGEEKWRFKMGKQTRSSPVVVGNVVYIGSGDGYLYEVNARTGAEIARYGVDSQIYTAPAVIEDTIYFLSGKGELYAVQKTPHLSGQEQAEAEKGFPANADPAGFQLTPGGWYVMGQDSVIRFQGRMVDGAGNPVNGFSVQADNGTTSFLSAPGGPNRWQSLAQDGEWEILIPQEEAKTGWWWLTAVRYECAETDFNPQCREFTRLSESVQVEIVYPAEAVIRADWTCQWDCQESGRK